MRKPYQIVLLLTCAQAMSACTSVGRRQSQPVSCPQPPQPPPSLMVEPTTESKVRGELLEPLPSATHR